MSNAVGGDKYKCYMDELMTLFCEENLSGNEVVEPMGEVGEYSIGINKYSAKIGAYNYKGAKCCLYKGDILCKDWYCFNSDAFYHLLRHKNGREYLIFRQDLYGYSVLDIENGELMQFFPECSLFGMETFIWTQVDYSSETDTLAVSGCYWACPYSVQLFSFEEPMSEKQKFVDIISRLDGDYDVYEELTFLKWENGDLYLSACVVEDLKTKELVISKEQYLKWLNDETAQFL